MQNDNLTLEKAAIVINHIKSTVLPIQCHAESLAFASCCEISVPVHPKTAG